MRYLNFLRRKRGLAGKEKIRIAVCGSCVGAGSTHLSIMLANYCANVCGLRTVITECDNHKDFLKICIETGRVRNDYRKFSYKNITFILEDDNEAMSKTLDSAEVIIYDCGCVGAKNEIYRLVDIRYAVLSASIYRMAKTLRFVDELGCECIYTCMFGGDKQIKVLSGKTDEPVLRIPYEGDPFHLSGRTASWISNMLYKHLF